MTQEEIRANAELIGDFMGASQGGGVYAFQIPRPERAPVYCQFTRNSAQFHHSWDWLMPVVEKIDQILPDDSFVLIEYNRCIIPVLEAEEPFDIDIVGNSRLEATYRAVVDFIHWHSEEESKQS